MGLFDAFKKKAAPAAPAALAAKPALTAAQLRSLGQEEMEAEHYDSAVEYFLQAAELGDAESAYLAAKICYDADSILLESEACAAWFIKAAEAGYVPAQTLLGELYSYGGCGLTEDSDKALYWLEQAAEQGVTEAMIGVGDLCVDRDEMEQAEAWYRKAYDAGDEQAMYKIGMMYRYGDNGEVPDGGKAVMAFAAAAGEGHGQAACELGRMYLDGEGVAKDEAKAVELFRKGAGASCAEAQYLLARCYLLGVGTWEDLTLAYLWMHRAADKGYNEAVCAMDQLYRTGIHVAFHDDRRYYWLMEAINAGDETAAQRLAQFPMTLSHVAEPQVKELRRRAEGGEHNAMMYMERLHLTGVNVRRSAEEAALWCERAARWERDNPDGALPQGVHPGECMYWAGINCLTGFGLDNYDHEGALYWLELAAERGSSDAMYMMGELYRIGHGVDEDVEKARSWHMDGAAKRNGCCLYALGRFYHQTVGGALGEMKAYEWYESASRQGHCRAALHYSYRLEHKEAEKAAELRQRLADNGEAKARYLLGMDAL